MMYLFCQVEFGRLKTNDLIPPAKIPEVKTRALELVYFEVTQLPVGWFILS